MHTRLLGLILLSLTALPVQAASLTAAAGLTEQGDATLRLAFNSAWQKRWWASDSGYLSGYWDAGYTYWNGGNRASAAHSVSFTPVLTYTFSQQRFQPYVELGLGVAAFSKTRVSSRKLGAAFSFEERLGVGLQLDNGDQLGVRAMHYSNAGLKKPNDGIESYSLFYNLAF